MASFNLRPLEFPATSYRGMVCKGYFRNAPLTADRFIPDPFSKEPADRLYKTGDLVRYRPDGHLEFLGRLDNQVKVRGSA